MTISPIRRFFGSKIFSRWALTSIAMSALILLGTVNPAAAHAAEVSQVSTVAATTPVTSASSSGMMTLGPMAAKAQNPNICDTASTGYSQAQDSQWLPVNRWSGAATDFHLRQGSGFFSKLSSTSFRVALVGMGMTVGNALTELSTNLASFAINFCLIDKVGGAVDRAGAAIGSLLFDSSIVTLAIAAGIVIAIFKSARGGGSGVIKGILQKVLVVGVFALMLAGASNSTGGGINKDDGGFRPGTGSPGWFAVKINNTISELANAPSYAFAETLHSLSDENEVADGSTVGGSNAANNSCSAYITMLRKGYEAQYGSGTDKVRSTVPVTMSAIWETTGLSAWRSAQFGDNDMADNVYCRILEVNADKPASTMVKRLGNGNGKDIGTHTGKPNVGAMAVFSRDANDQTDRSLVAWAACVPKGGSAKLTTGPAKILLKEGDGNARCADWWNDGAKDFDGDEFDWGSGTGDINEEFGSKADADSVQAKDFLTALHQTKNTEGITAVFVYMLSSICLLVVFGGISIAIIISKIAAMMMVLGALVMLFATMLPSSDTSKAVNFFKSFVGVSLFAFAGQFILMLVVLIAGILTSAAHALLPGGPFGVLQMMWAGLSPLMAVLVIHWMFKKIKLPSPFKMSGGLAWAGAGAAAGGAAAHSLDRMESKFGSKGKQAALDKMGISKGTGTGRTNTMNPDGIKKRIDKNGDGILTKKETTAAYKEEAAKEKQVEATQTRVAAAQTRIEGGNASGGDKRYVAKQARISSNTMTGLDRAAGAVGSRINAAKAEFKAKPLQTSLKYAAAGMVAGSSVGVLGVAAAPVVYGGYKAAKSAVKSGAHEVGELRPSQRAAQIDKKAQAWAQEKSQQEDQARVTATKAKQDAEHDRRSTEAARKVVQQQTNSQARQDAHGVTVGQMPGQGQIY